MGNAQRQRAACNAVGNIRAYLPVRTNKFYLRLRRRGASGGVSGECLLKIRITAWGIVEVRYRFAKTRRVIIGKLHLEMPEGVSYLLKQLRRGCRLQTHDTAHIHVCAPAAALRIGIVFFSVLGKYKIQRSAADVSALGFELAADMPGDSDDVFHKTVGIFEHGCVYTLEDIPFAALGVNEICSVYMSLCTLMVGDRSGCKTEFGCNIKYFCAHVNTQLSYVFGNRPATGHSASFSGYSPDRISSRMLCFTGSLSAA